jgi:penicillin-binding protein 2
MFSARDLMSSSGSEQPPIDRLKLRLAVLGVLVVAVFVALFSRLWYLQVLAADEFEQLAKENRVRTVYSEPARGRILDRNGFVLVDNRPSTTVTVDREIVETPVKKAAIFKRLSRLLKVPVQELNERLNDVNVSPYKPVALAYDVPLGVVSWIESNPENFEGVEIETRPVRFYPQGQWAAQILGYVGEITETMLEEDYFSKARPIYRPGDIVGRTGLERAYDKQLRGRPAISRLVVNSSNKVVDSTQVQEAEPGADLITHLDIRIQKAAEQALAAGIAANKAANYTPTDAAALVLDPNTGGVVAMASYPTFDPSLLADGFQTKDDKILGGATPDYEPDDATKNRTITAANSPGSVFKVPVALAALSLGVSDIDELIDCPNVREFGADQQAFRNWSPINYGLIDYARSLEISCDTFYYELGWRMEDRWGAGNGDGSERFQKALRRLGFDNPTGIDLPNETGGVIPDQKWLNDYCKAVDGAAGCTDWFPGYSVNMSIGQFSLTVTPLQMALNYAAVINGGKMLEPSVASYFGRPRHELTTIEEELPSVAPLASVSPTGSPTPSPSPSGELSPTPTPVLTPSPSPSPSPSGFSTDLTGSEARASLDDEKVVSRVKTKVVGRLPVGPEVLEELRQGLEDVVTGDEGTAGSAFTGFPLDRIQIAGKTGTAEIGETGKNRAWFISYAPAEDPQYVIAVYMNEAGHGGESAAPIAREIYEAIFGIDNATGDVSLGQDASG